MTRPFIPYSSGAFFTSPVAGAPVNATRTTAFHNFMTTFVDQKGTTAPLIKGLPGNNWGTAFAFGHASDPIWKLTGTVPPEVAILKTQGFHAPANFGQRLTGTADSPFCCMDMATGWTVWAAKSAPGASNTISVGAAGLYEHSSNGLDRRNPLSNSTLNFRSRGAIPDGMVIRRDLIDYGINNNTGLGHVLHMFMVLTDQTAGFCSPMTGNENKGVGFGAEGERIFIRPDVNLNTRGLSPFGLVIARTLQQHGCYIGDNASGPSTLKAEQSSSVYNPWAGLTVAEGALDGKVTWADFAVATQGWQ